MNFTYKQKCIYSSWTLQEFIPTVKKRDQDQSPSKVVVFLYVAACFWYSIHQFHKLLIMDAFHTIHNFLCSDVLWKELTFSQNFFCPLAILITCQTYQKVFLLKLWKNIVGVNDATLVHNFFLFHIVTKLWQCLIRIKTFSRDPK